MRRVGQIRRRDSNEQDIVDALMALPHTVVFRLSARGCPDLLVGHRGRWVPMEVKTDKGELTEAQWESFNGNPYPIVRTVDDALRALGVQS